MACMSSIIFGGVQMQRLKFQESGLEAGWAWLSPPLKKWDLGGFQVIILNPPCPPFPKGG